MPSTNLDIKNAKPYQRRMPEKCLGMLVSSKIYELLGLDEESAIPIKCLIIYPDQDKNEFFTFNREKSPNSKEYQDM